MYYTKEEYNQITGKSYKDSKPSNSDSSFKPNKERKLNKRPRYNSPKPAEIYIVYYIEKDANPNRQALDYTCSQHSTPDRNTFIKYRILDPTVDNTRPISGILGNLVPINISKVYVNTIKDG